MLAELAPDMGTEPPLDSWLPEVLTFAPGSGLSDLKRRFVMLLSERWGEWVGANARRDRAAGERLQGRISDLPPQSFFRILTAPESVRRLLWSSGDVAELEQNTRFFARAIEAERALCSLDHDLPDPSWTAMGDRAAPAGALAGEYVVDGLPRLVIGDPAARTPLASGPDGDLADVPRVIDRLHEVMARLRATDPVFADFARELNITLVLRRDTARPDFQSNSPERYVGRSILWNPDGDDVGLDDLAEALIHEGIHTALDMADALLFRAWPRGTRWITDPALYDGVSRTASPWTGRPLDVPSYVHAFLVWFGLLTFWARAASRGSFDASVARRRLLRAGAPFAARAALPPLAPFLGSIRPDLLPIMDQLEEFVSETFGELAAAT